MTLSVVPFAPPHLAAAAELLAARHRADRLRVAELPPGLDDPAVAQSALEALLGTLTVDGWVALADTRPVGYLIGTRVISPETSLAAAYYAPRAVHIPFAGYATRPADGAAVLGALYAAATARWAGDGYLNHHVRTTGDPAGIAPWFALGFGGRVAYGLRRLDADKGEATAPAAAPPFVKRRAGPGDIDAVLALVGELMRFHAASPVFVPYPPEALAAERAEIEAALADPAVGYWLAEADGEAIGLMGLHPAEGIVGDGLRPDRCAYLDVGHVAPSARGGGVGTALLERALGWARDAGYTACATTWYLTNPLADGFWPRRGFVPFAYRLGHRLDPRVAWATA